MDLPAWIRTGDTNLQIVLDPTSELERSLGRYGCFGLLAAPLLWFLHQAHFLPFPLQTRHLWVCLTLGLGFWLGRALLNDRYILDYKAKQLLFCRSFLGRHQQDFECSFTGLRAVAVECVQAEKERGAPLYYYGLSLILRDGRRLPISQPNRRDYTGAVRVGRRLAEEANIEFFPPERQRQLWVSRDKIGVQLEYRPFPYG